MWSTTGALPNASGGSELERIRSTVTRFFPVYETRLGPQSLILTVRTEPASLEAKFDALRQELRRQGYIPLLRRERGEDFVEVIRRPKIVGRRSWVNLALLGATLVTTIFAGGVIWLAYTGGAALGLVDFANGALFFAIPVLTILGVHELAHYLVARRRHLDASLPFFLPVPPPFLFGTFGAFISIREPFPDRKALFDVGASGPIAGFLASIPITLAGLDLSAHAPEVSLSNCGATVLGQNYSNLLIGKSAFWSVLSLFGPTGPNLHPLAFAGWVGLLVTAINLLPAGTLDGGHIFRALLGDRARYVSYAAALLLFGLSIEYLGWAIFGILVLFLGLRHPPPLNDLTRLDGKRYLAGAFVAAVLVAGFVLVPIATPAGAIGLTNSEVAYPTHGPGIAIAANLSVTVKNLDPIPHGFVYSATVVNVSVNGSGSQARYLTSAEIANWTRTINWTYVAANGTPVRLATPAFALPSADFVTVDSATQQPLAVEFTNSVYAITVTVQLSVNELCATSGTGSETTGITATF